MKNLLKTFVLFMLVMTFSCSNDENTEQDLSSEIELVSPKGFKVANSISELKTIIGIKDIESIEKIEYVEHKDVSASLIYFKRKGSDLIENLAYGKGKINVDASELEFSPKSHGDTWVVSCGGCECTVGGTITDEGVTFSCSASCCKATITKK